MVERILDSVGRASATGVPVPNIWANSTVGYRTTDGHVRRAVVQAAYAGSVVDLYTVIGIGDNTDPVKMYAIPLGYPDATGLPANKTWWPIYPWPERVIPPFGGVWPLHSWPMKPGDVPASPYGS